MSLPSIILRLLIEGASHGYALQKNLAKLRHFYPLSNVNVYPVLRDLEEQGLVCSRTELSGARVRKIYEITAAGVTAFETWIDTPCEEWLPVQRDTVGLKLLLAMNYDVSDLSWLELCIRGLDKEIDRVRKSIDYGRDGLSRLALLTAEHQLASHLLRREYLVQALRISSSARED